MEKNNKYIDSKYKEFITKLVPNITSDRILGIRIPILRKLAKEIVNKEDYLANPIHYYLEENLIHALLINEIKDTNKYITELDKFSYYIDNWEVSDIIRVNKYIDKNILYNYLYKLLDDNYPYRLRVSIFLFMLYYKNDDRINKIVEKIITINSYDYYVEMMIAWYFCELYISNNQLFYKYFNYLDINVKKMTIRKCLDSNKIKDKEEIRRIIWN